MEVIITICAWCEKKLEEKLVPSEDEENESPEIETKISHGICKNCMHTYFGKSLEG